MGRMKDTIPEEYSCNHYLDVNDCMDCQFSMQQINSDWLASQTPPKISEQKSNLEKWYNKKPKTKKKRRSKWRI